MAMTEDERVEKVQRLLTAHRKTREVLENEPVMWEIHPGTEIAGNWAVVTAAYSGLEQTIKYLLAEENGLSIAELIEFREGRSRPYHTHDVSRLFSKLAEPTQDIVEDFYGRYRSLHAYITIETVEKFLGLISEADGSGYQRWRYTLIEDRPIPTNSPEALVAIWGVCVQIAEERLWKNSRVRTPDQMLVSRFGMELDELMLRVTVERQNEGEPFVDIAPEVNDWARRTGHPLNAFADVLWHFTRYGEHGQGDVSPWLSDTLSRWAQRVMNDPARAGTTSLRVFVERAQGATRGGQGIRWDRDVNRFEAVPWSLENQCRPEPPPDAVEIRDATGLRLRALWQAARRSGYRVFENRAFEGPPNEDPWFCTIELRPADDGDESPILSIWQKEMNIAGEFHMVEQRSRAAMDEHVRTWIEVVALKAAPQATWVPV